MVLEAAGGTTSKADACGRSKAGSEGCRKPSMDCGHEQNCDNRKQQMTLPRSLLLRAQWRRRLESPAGVSQRTWTLLTALEEWGGLFEIPFYALVDSPFVISGYRDRVDSLVEAGRDFDGPNGGINVVSGMRVAALQRPLDGPDVPRVHLSIRAGATAGGGGGTVANQALVKIVPSPLGAENKLITEILAEGVRLVERMVEIWEPDVVSLDSRELLEAQQNWRATVPKIGFATWLSDDVATGDLSGVPVFRRRCFDRGSLSSVDLRSDHVLEDGLALVNQITKTALLKELPLVY